MDVNLLRIAVTVLSFAAFIGIVAYAMHPRNRERFEAAGRLPDDEGESDSATPSPTLPQGGGSNRRTRFVEGEQVR